MEIREVKTPALKHDTDVLIKMGAIGVCGSDVHYFVEGNIGSQVVQYPFAVGHECGGIVTQVGSAVTRVAPGDTIAVDPAMPCFSCDQCIQGRTHTCRNLKFLGCPGQADGCLCEYIVMPETSCFPVTDALSVEEAALSEPLAIGVYAVSLSGNLAGKNIGVLGCGPIGLSVITAAKYQNCKKIYATDVLDYRCAFAKRWGADWSVNPETTDVITQVNELQQDQLDVVFECCGEQVAIDQAIEIIKPGGQLTLIGIPRTNRISFNIDKLRRKEIRIQNIRRQNECVTATLDLIKNLTKPITPMITHRFSLEDTQQAFELVSRYGDNAIKAMIIL